MTSRIRTARLLVALALGATALGALAGCTAPEPVTPEELQRDLEALPGVTEAQILGESHALVTVGTGADDAQVLAAAVAAAELARDGDWPGEVVLEREHDGLDPATDLPGRTPWSQRVFPGDPDEVAAVLDELLVLEAHPDVVSVAVIDGWRYVTLASLDTFVATFEELSALPRFSEGATFSYQGEAPSLKIVHIPERISDEAVAAIVRIALENPGCEVELASMTTGTRWPELYVAHLDEAQVPVVAAQLRDPALADADPEGYSLPFQLSFVGPGGPVYTQGTFGDVPDTSS